MTLKHLTRTEVKGGYLGQTIHRLIDPDGHYIEAFDRFSKHLVYQQYPWTTRKRYSEASARFLDYLFEVGVLGVETENYKLNQAVAAYPILLRDGSNYLGSDVTDISVAESETRKLSEYAKAVGMKHGLSGKSFGPTIAAINLFLTFAQDLAKEDVFRAIQSGLSVADELRIEAIDGFTQLSRFEKIRLKQNSMLAAVKRDCGDIRRPRGLKSSAKHPQQIDHEKLDFPLMDFSKLIAAATNYRDKALWTLLAASGIRESEAVNLQLEHIDPVARQVYVMDPNQTRFGRHMTQDEAQRFKGRVTSRTYLFEPLRSEFYRWFELYLRHEFVPTAAHSYVFQIIMQGKDRGKPLRKASDAARIESFKRTVKRARVKGPDVAPGYIWTPHSLRHMYGVYMLNYIPVPGGFGLRDSEVQMLMGHKDINSTRHYARQDDTMLRVKLEAADRLIYEGSFDVSDFPLLIAERLISEAERFKRLARRNND